MTLVATSVSCELSGTRILSGVSLTAQPGQVTAIIGANGSGKTTLMRHLTGELRPTEGQVMLNGTDLSAISAPELARRRAVMPQASQLSFPFTVAEVVSLANTHIDAARISAALSRVDLGGYGSRMYQSLSGGEQARVHLARVLLQVWQPVSDDGPAWLFLDEPVSALDLAHQLWVTREARRFADAGGGVAVILHDLNLTAMLADQVVLLDAGRVLASGAPDRVLTSALLSKAYGCQINIGKPPTSGLYVLPQTAALA